MLARAQSVLKRDSLYYALGAKKFCDIESVLHPVAENVIEYAMETANFEMAFVFSSLNRMTRKMLVDALNKQTFSDYLGPVGMCEYPPVFSNIRERVAWIFRMCHTCGRNVGYYCTVQNIYQGNEMSVQLCDCCYAHNFVHRVGPRGIYLNGGTFVITGCDVLRGNGDALKIIARNLPEVRTRVVVVARQRWTSTARAARRSVPFPSSGSAKTPNTSGVGGGRVRSTRVTEIAVVVAIPGVKQTRIYNLCIPDAIARKIIHASDSSYRIRLLLCEGVTRLQRIGLIKYLTTAPLEAHCTNSRKQSVPLQLPPSVCNHGFGFSRRSFKLLKCSACANV